MIRLALLLACLGTGAALAQPAADTLNSAELEELTALYQQLHAAPELSGQEVRTAARLAAELRALGYEVSEGVGRYERPGWTGHGVVAVRRHGEGPTVLVRADMDALPVEEKTGLPYASQVRTRAEGGQETGVMHACGHDVHVACLVGVARVLARNQDRWQGTLVLLGQPAEEVVAGARSLLADELYTRFPRPDFVLALHDHAELAAGRVALCPGYALASSTSVDLLIRGIGGHGSKPETARDPVVVAAQVILALQTIVSREVPPLEAAVVTVGSVHGGTKHNIIPAEVKLQLTVRTYKEEIRRQILAAIERIARGTAQAAGIPDSLAPVVKEVQYVPATYNDPALTERLGGAMSRSLGAGQVGSWPPVMAGEDFAYYRLDGQIPTCIFWLGAVDPALVAGGGPLPSLHSAFFAPLPAPTLRTGVAAMTSAVLELLGKP